MNTTEVSMPQPLIATQKATEAAGNAIRLVMVVKSPLKSVADQVIRSADRQTMLPMVRWASCPPCGRFSGRRAVFAGWKPTPP
jgi:4-hydroxy-3-methylbut-2-en-1-yl diphosphate synthase IspG/GcpE